MASKASKKKGRKSDDGDFRPEEEDEDEVYAINGKKKRELEKEVQSITSGKNTIIDPSAGLTLRSQTRGDSALKTGKKASSSCFSATCISTYALLFVVILVAGTAFIPARKPLHNWPLSTPRLLHVYETMQQYLPRQPHAVNALCNALASHVGDRPLSLVLAGSISLRANITVQKLARSLFLSLLHPSSYILFFDPNLHKGNLSEMLSTQFRSSFSPSSSSSSTSASSSASIVVLTGPPSSHADSAALRAALTTGEVTSSVSNERVSTKEGIFLLYVEGLEDAVDKLIVADRVGEVESLVRQRMRGLGWEDIPVDSVLPYAR